MIRCLLAMFAVLALSFASCGDEDEGSSAQVGPEGWQEECSSRDMPSSCPDEMECLFSRCTIPCERDVDTKCIGIDPGTECYTYTVEIEGTEESYDVSACLPEGYFPE